jgi:transposase
LHHALDITIPDNILLLFQPAYSPQVNPIERFCQELKKQLRWQIFDNLDELRKNLSKYINELTPELMSSVSRWTFILDALSAANI